MEIWILFVEVIITCVISGFIDVHVIDKYVKDTLKNKFISILFYVSIYALVLLLFNLFL